MKRVIQLLAVVAMLASAYGCLDRQEQTISTSAAATGNAQVTDISGKKYFPAVHGGFVNAKKSIRVAMYRIKIYPGGKKYLANILAQDLIDAHKRGVDVVVHLDDSSDSAEDAGSDKDERNRPVYAMLKAAGVDVRLMNPSRKLHAKLIVIDGRTVVEGSANWSYSALTRNAESTSLIVSEAYAAEKGAWIDSL